MRIEHLEECIDLAQTLNFTQTASRFYLTQPALSRHVSALEALLGFRIFKRDQHSVELTAAGKQFVADAKQVVDSYHKMMDNALNFGPEASDTLSVGYLLGAAGHLIPTIQSEFLTYEETHGLPGPALEIRYFSLEFADIAGALADDKVDLIIGALTPNIASAQYAYEELYTDQYYAVVRRGHRLADVSSVGPEDLEGETVAAPSHTFWSDNAEAIRSYLLPVEGRVALKYSLQDMHSLPLLMKTEDCVGISMGHLSRYFGEEAVFIPLRGWPWDFKVGIAWKKDNDNPHIQPLVKLVKSIMGDVDPTPPSLRVAGLLTPLSK